MRWVAPQSSADSDFEVEDDEVLEENLMFDDDVVDPDFVLNIGDDDLIPSSAGMNMLKMLQGQCGANFKRTEVCFVYIFLKGQCGAIFKGTGVCVLFTFF